MKYLRFSSFCILVAFCSIILFPSYGLHNNGHCDGWFYFGLASNPENFFYKQTYYGDRITIFLPIYFFLKNITFDYYQICILILNVLFPSLIVTIILKKYFSISVILVSLFSIFCSISFLGVSSTTYNSNIFGLLLVYYSCLYVLHHDQNKKSLIFFIFFLKYLIFVTNPIFLILIINFYIYFFYQILKKKNISLASFIFKNIKISIAGLLSSFLIIELLNFYFLDNSSLTLRETFLYIFTDNNFLEKNFLEEGEDFFNFKRTFLTPPLFYIFLSICFYFYFLNYKKNQFIIDHAAIVFLTFIIILIFSLVTKTALFVYDYYYIMYLSLFFILILYFLKLNEKNLYLSFVIFFICLLISKFIIIFVQKNNFFYFFNFNFYNFFLYIYIIHFFLFFIFLKNKLISLISLSIVLGINFNLVLNRDYGASIYFDKNLLLNDRKQFEIYKDVYYTNKLISKFTSNNYQTWSLNDRNNNASYYTARSLGTCDYPIYPDTTFRFKRKNIEGKFYTIFFDDEFLKTKEIKFELLKDNIKKVHKPIESYNKKYQIHIIEHY